MQQETFRILPNPDGGMDPSHMTPPENFTGGDQTELVKSFFETPDESISVGVWECAPSREEIDAYPVHEMMTVISGSVTLTNAEGKSETFTAGDTFFVIKGSKVIWEITETLRKYYMIVA